MLAMRIESFKHVPSYNEVMSLDGARPRVGISRCLLGDEVRYDGGHKRDALLISTLGAIVEWVPVCPEVEAGMGTPREAIDLIESDDGVPAGQARVVAETLVERGGRRCRSLDSLRSLGMTPARCARSG